MTIDESVLGVISSVVIALIGATVSFITVRNNRNAQKESTRVENDANALDSWTNLYDRVYKELQDVKTELEAQRTASDETRDRVRDLRTELDAAKIELHQTRVELGESNKLRQRLENDLHLVFDWIDGGMVPPPPIRPDYLKGSN